MAFKMVKPYGGRNPHGRNLAAAIAEKDEEIRRLRDLLGQALELLASAAEMSPDHEDKPRLVRDALALAAAMRELQKKAVR